MGVGWLVSGVAGSSCVSEEVTGKFSLCNICLSSVEVMGVCPAAVCVLSSAAFL